MANPENSSAERDLPPLPQIVPSGGSTGAVLLVVFGLLVLFLGAAMLTRATLGIGVVCIAVALLVLARLAQARAQHLHLVDQIRRARDDGYISLPTPRDR